MTVVGQVLLRRNVFSLSERRYLTPDNFRQCREQKELGNISRKQQQRQVHIFGLFWVHIFKGNQHQKKLFFALKIDLDGSNPKSGNCTVLYRVIWRENVCWRTYSSADFSTHIKLGRFQIPAIVFLLCSPFSHLHQWFTCQTYVSVLLGLYFLSHFGSCHQKLFSSLNKCIYFKFLSKTMWAKFVFIHF